MKPETLFTICNNVAVIGWILLIFAPRWKWTTRLVLAGAVPLLLALVYLFLIVTNIGHAEGGFGSLAGVAQLFRNEKILLAGWVHYLVFDLFVGAWEVRDAQKLKLNHLLIVPCLLLTFLFGPIGFLLYHAVSFKARQKHNST